MSSQRKVGSGLSLPARKRVDTMVTHGYHEQSKGPACEKQEEFFQQQVGIFNGHLVEKCDGTHQLVVDEYCVPLTPSEYRIAVALLEHYGRPVPIEDLVEGVFEAGRDRRPLFKHITCVRKALEPLLHIRIEYDSLCQNGGYIMLPLVWEADEAGGSKDARVGPVERRSHARSQQQSGTAS